MVSGRESPSKITEVGVSDRIVTLESENMAQSTIVAMPSPTFYMANNDYDVLVQSHELERVPDINTVSKAA